MNRREFLTFRSERRKRVVELSCERLYMHVLDAQLTCDAHETTGGPADGEPAAVFEKRTPGQLFEQIDRDLDGADVLRIVGANWMASGPLHGRLDRVVDRFRAAGGRVVLCSVVLAAVLCGDAAARQSSSRPLVSEAQYLRWQTELSNWGRWGKDDQLGTLNLVTPSKRRAAMALVKEGVPVSLSTNTFTEKAVDVPCPAEWGMTSATDSGATDRVAYPCIHGAAATHIDSLAHTFFRGKMWNGYDTAALVTGEKGAEKNSVLPMKTGIVTRGVLYDIARLKGVPYLAPGDRIFVDDLEAWEKKSGAKAGPGDALILRWGRYGRRGKLGPDDGAAGLDNSVLPWLKQRDIALLVWETAGYSPQPAGDLPRNAVHNFIQAILGIHVLDRADLEALSEATASRNRWEFMLTVTPLALPNATGSPVNPIAMF